MVKGSFQTAINGDLKLTGQQNVAKPTKEFAFLGSTPDSVILMLCQQLLSLTSDSAQAEQDPLQKKKNLPMSYIASIFWAFKKVKISANARKFTSPRIQNYVTKLRDNDLALE